MTHSHSHKPLDKESERLVKCRQRLVLLACLRLRLGIHQSKGTAAPSVSALLPMGGTLATVVCLDNSLEPCQACRKDCLDGQLLGAGHPRGRGGASRLG